MSLSEKLASYHATVIEVHAIEKQIQDFFNLLANRDSLKFDRGADYGERQIEIVIPFDEINLSLLTPESIEKINKIIVLHRTLRKKQRLLESEVSEKNAIEDSIKNQIGIL